MVSRKKSIGFCFCASALLAVGAQSQLFAISTCQSIIERFGFHEKIHPPITATSPIRYEAVDRFIGQIWHGFLGIESTVQTKEDAQALSSFFETSLPSTSRLPQTFTTDQLLPPRVVRGIGQPCLGYRTNCFNTALRYHNPNRPDGYTYWKGFQFDLEDYYRLLDPDSDTLQAGDVIAFWESESDFRKEQPISHAGIYMGSNLFYHKLNFQESTTPLFSDLDYHFNRSDQNFYLRFYRLRSDVDLPKTTGADSILR